MSRSIKAPFYSDANRGRKKEKRFANKRVRRREAVSNGKSYRKVYESWRIKDWSYQSNEPKAARK